MSRFYQLPPVSSRFIELAELQSICGEQFVRPFLQLFFVLTVHIFNHFSLLHEIAVNALQVDIPFAVMGVEPYPPCLWSCRL